MRDMSDKPLPSYDQHGLSETPKMKCNKRNLISDGGMKIPTLTQWILHHCIVIEPPVRVNIFIPPSEIKFLLLHFISGVSYILVSCIPLGEWII